jgi:hypothetical protein
LSKTGKQIAIAEALVVNKSLTDSMFNNDEVSLIIRLAWNARRSSATHKSEVYEKIALLIQDVSKRAVTDGQKSVER